MDKILSDKMGHDMEALVWETAVWWAGTAVAPAYGYWVCVFNPAGGQDSVFTIRRKERVWG